MNSLIDRVIDWFAPFGGMPFEQQAAEQQQTAAVEYMARSSELLAEIYRIRRRQEQLSALDTRRNSMIGRLDDCRWRVSVLMASKNLPADYAMRMKQ